MHDWNVVVTVRERGFRKAIDLLEDFGPINKTDFFNVLVMRVDDTQYMMERLTSESTEDPGIFSILARIIPADHTINFHTPQEFETRAKEVVLQLAPQLAGKGFHVRMHRRGFKGRLASTEEERFLDEIILNTLEKKGSPGRITFDNPDAIVSVETVGQRAGLSLWSRQKLERYPLLGLL